MPNMTTPLGYIAPMTGRSYNVLKEIFDVLTLIQPKIGLDFAASTFGFSS
jgi:hypothetical protein